MTTCPKCGAPLVYSIQYYGAVWWCGYCGYHPTYYSTNKSSEEKEVEITLDATYQSL